MEVASFRASQFYEIASFGISFGSNCKILSLLLEGHCRHYPLLQLQCIYSVQLYTIDLKYVQCKCTCQLQIYRCLCITDQVWSQDDWILAKLIVILLPLHVHVCPASLTHKNPRRCKIIHCMRPMGCKYRSMDLKYLVCVITHLLWQFELHCIMANV